MTDIHSDKESKNIKIKLKSDYEDEQSIFINVFMPMILTKELLKKVFSEKGDKDE